MANDYYIKSHITEIYDCHPDNLWVLVEQAKKLTPTRFKELTGVSIELLNSFLSNQYSKNNPSKRMGLRSMSPEMEQHLHDNEFASGIMDVMLNYGMPAGDLGRLSSYGEVIRDGKPDVVLTDYGLSDEVYSSHYQREGLREYFGHDIPDVSVDFDGGRILSNGEVVGEIDFWIRDYDDQKWGSLDKIAISKEHRGQGYGQRAMEKLIDHANQNNIIITLTPDEVFGGNRNQLEKWYKSLGFVLNKGKNKDYRTTQLMYRLPDGLNEYLQQQDLEDHSVTVDQVKDGGYGGFALQPDSVSQGGLNNEDLGYWHASDATKDKYELMPEAVQGVSNRTVNDLASKVSTKLGYGENPILIGGGENGMAYSLSPQLVLKITGDASEASASSKLKGREAKHLVKIYNVYKLTSNQFEGKDIYAIVLEKINTAAQGRIESMVNQMDDMIYKALDEKEDFDKIMLTYMMNPDYYEDVYHDVIEDIIGDHPDLSTLYNQFLDLIDELRDHGINSGDFLTMDNLGYRGNDLVYFDIGAADRVDFGKRKVKTMAMAEGGDTLYTNKYGSRDEDFLDERKISYMPNSSLVTVKKRCRIGGKGDGTSDACNQGDINALNIQPIKEN
jgi:ribosomal protein S18 acetylase RimI-like enzyme